MASQPHAQEGATEKRHLFDEPQNVKRLIGGFFVLCALVLALDLVIHRHLSFADNAFPVEGWFGFYAFYGFVACVLLVLVAKEMRKVLMRREDYYER
jgi:hypothetical protein